jgi:hypothetical protein
MAAVSASLDFAPDYWGGKDEQALEQLLHSLSSR